MGRRGGRPSANESDQRRWVTIKQSLPAEVGANFNHALWIAKAMGCTSSVEAFDMVAAEFLSSALPAFKQQAREMSRDEYSMTRWEVLNRDGWACTKCGTSKNLHVHHITPRSHYGKKRRAERDHPDNLATLCHECHEAIHRTVPS